MLSPALCLPSVCWQFAPLQATSTLCAACHPVFGRSKALIAHGRWYRRPRKYSADRGVSRPTGVGKPRGGTPCGSQRISAQHGSRFLVPPTRVPIAPSRSGAPPRRENLHRGGFVGRRWPQRSCAHVVDRAATSMGHLAKTSDPIQGTIAVIENHSSIPWIVATCAHPRATRFCPAIFSEVGGSSPSQFINPARKVRLLPWK